MKLTAEQEANYIRDYEPYLVKRVQKFMRSTNRSSMEYEDLMQEARLAFLEHIRQIDDCARICACHKSIIHALYDHCMRMSPAHIGEHHFKNMMKKVSVVSLEAIDDNESSIIDFDDLINQRIELECFMNSLSLADKYILSLKQQGYNGREIAQKMGYNSETYVSRRFANIKRRYSDYYSGKGNENA